MEKITISKDISKLEVDLLKEYYFRESLSILEDTEEDTLLPVHTFKEGLVLNRPYDMQMLIEQHRRNKIYPTYGIPLNDFLNMTSNDVSMLLIDSNNAKKTGDKALEGVLGNLLDGDVS